MCLGRRFRGRRRVGNLGMRLKFRADEMSTLHAWATSQKRGHGKSKWPQLAAAFGGKAREMWR